MSNLLNCLQIDEKDASRPDPNLADKPIEPVERLEKSVLDNSSLLDNQAYSSENSQKSESKADSDEEEEEY